MSCETAKHIGALTLLAGWLLALPACTTLEPYIAEPYEGWEDRAPTSEPVYRVFLVGDAGGPTLDPLEPTLRLLRSYLAQADSNSAVVFLGDNIYCCGLPDSGTVRRTNAERRLEAQLKTVEGFAGRVVFIPGNHDWNHSEPGGLAALARQERFVEAYLGRGNTFLPDDGFPGPAVVDLTDRLKLVAIDTEWWLHEHTKSYGDTGEYDLDEDADFLLELDDLIKRRDDDDLLVVGHHPLFTNGSHAGILPLRDHLFPLRKVHPALAIPLPIVGSIYPLYVRFNGGRQNIYHPRYRALRTALMRIFNQHESLVYASGHDHALQYFPYSAPPENYTQHYVVSGAASRPSPVGRGRGAAFASGHEGFAVLHYYRDGSTWLEMIATDDDGASGTRLFFTNLKGPARELVDPGVPPTVETVDYRDSTVVAAAGPRYAASDVKEFFLGSHHREAWTTPIEAPVLDLGQEAGGMTIGKRGGGQQTISLRLENPEGHEYVLRSIDKDPSGTVPANLQGTVATDVVQDQIASIHPYGAFIIPPLAEAAGIYHTNPKIVYVPNDPRLGIYRPLFGDKIAMLEERPNNDMSHAESFGRSRDVVSAAKFYREIDGDNDHRVDHRAFARARLFDMLLSDWDRHSDQWRWASFEPYELNPALEGEARTQGKIYRPIPRDRDFAFNKLNGLFPSFAGQFDIKFQDFTESYGSLVGLNFNGRFQDRRLLNALSRHDWIEIADSLRMSITDEVIDRAVLNWPEPIYQLDGPRTARLLKLRRDKLTRVAETFYEIHADVVDVVGSNKHERFEVTRMGDSTRVVVYKTSKQGEIRRPIYRRMFFEDETREIRLYGLDGNDTFVIDGSGIGIRVRAVGGAGKDRFVDTSTRRGKQNRFYDTESGNDWDESGDAKLYRSDDNPEVNFYDRRGFQFNSRFPVLFFGNNKDDGFFLGGGMNFMRHGFRKRPYSKSHTIKANIATKTQAFNIVYEGHYVRIFGSWDVMLDAAYLSPDNIRNFYGLGNETENTEASRRFYQARLTQALFSPSLYTELEQGVTLQIGPRVEVTRVREDEDRFLAIQPGISPSTFDDQWFAGLDLEVVLDTRDFSPNPKLGFAWTNEAALNLGVRNNTDTFARLATDLVFYLSPSLSPQVTLAARLGAAHNIGDFPFYSAVTLGGRENLRGHRSTRFAGRSSFYQNVDLRIQLFRFSTYLAVGRAGLLGFLDNGRVWTDGESSSVWHQGYGGGLWFELFRTFVLNTYAGFSEDDQTLTVKFGFQY